MITENSTIKEAKIEMRAKITKGFVCPCCNRWGQQYSRTITSSMAYGLILIYNLKTDSFIHVEDLFKQMDIPASVRGDFPKLRFWDLIRPDGDTKEDGNPNTGLYKITEQGKAFVEGKITLPKHANIYNNKFYGYNMETGYIGIKEALKGKFDYDKLMTNG